MLVYEDMHMTRRLWCWIAKGNWFHTIPHRFFKYPAWMFSSYVGIGYLLVGIMHYRIWTGNGRVENIFSNLGWNGPQVSPAIALFLFVVTAIMTAAALQILFEHVGPNKDGGAAELVFWGTGVSVGGAWAPWLFASSVTGTLFLSMYGMIAVVGFAVVHYVLSYADSSVRLSPFSPWIVFTSAVRVCVTIVAIVLGAVATSVLLPWRHTRVEGGELVRYALLSAWMVTGMLVFVLIPLFVTAIKRGGSGEDDDSRS